jgi:tetratricopeptide (TPR) repeat protein
MRSEERHELEKNTLDEELGKLVAFLRERGTQLATVLLVIAVTVLVVVFFVRRSRANRAAVVNQYSQVTWAGGQMSQEQRVEQLKALAGQDTVEIVAAESMFLLGGHYADMMFRAETPARRDELARQATAEYERILNLYPDRRLLVAKAHLGIGNIAQSLGEMDKARSHYNAVAAMEGLQGQPVLTLAQMYLAGLEQLGGREIRMADKAPAPRIDPNDIDIDLPQGPAGIDANVPGTDDAGQPDAADEANAPSDR